MTLNELDQICQRWADVRWRCTEDREGAYLANAYLLDDAHDSTILDLEEPNSVEQHFLHLAAAAPDDVRTLLARLEQAEATAAAMRTTLASVGTVIHWRHREEEPGVPIGDCSRDACTTIREALSGQAGQALLAELAELRASQAATQAFVRGLMTQIGAGDIPLPVAIAQLRSEALAARRLADAIAGHRGCLVDDPVLDAALAAYEAARKGGTDAE